MTLYVLSDTNSGTVSRHLTLAEAGRQRAELGETSFEVRAGFYHPGETRMIDEDGFNLFSQRPSEPVATATVIYGQTEDECWEKFAFVDWRAAAGDVQTAADYDRMIAGMMADEDTGALECYRGDPAVMAWLNARETDE